MKPNRLLTTIFILSSLNLSAQKIRYKDVYNLIQKKDIEKAFPLLKLIVKADTTNASANLYLGSIFYEKAKTFDPLKENDAATLSCDSALFYLRRANRQVNEKEIKKNDDYYLSYQKNKKDTTKLISDRDTILRRVKADVDFKLNDISRYKEEISKSFKAFNKSIAFYNQARYSFKNISTRYHSVKQLCLVTDAAIEKEISSLASQYDSSVNHFNLYKKYTKEYPLKGYNQQMEVQSIETFRLDGLSNSNFLSPKIITWNYGKWAKEILVLIEKDIKYLKSKSFEKDDFYNKTFDKILTHQITYDSASSVKVDNKLYMLLKKYDHNSHIWKLLDYKHKKLVFAANTLNRFYPVENTTAENFDQKVNLYQNLLADLNKADTALLTLKAVNWKEESAKYNFFIQKKFIDAEGAKKYIENEEEYLGLQKKENRIKLNQLIYHYLINHVDSAAYISFNNYQIPIFKSYENSKSPVKTTVLQEDRKGNLFIGGYIQGAGTATNAFVCKVNKNKQVSWFKSIPVKTENKTTGEFTSAIDPFEEGCYLMINGKSGTTVKNILMKFDKDGQELISKPLIVGAVVRQLIYDPVNDQYLMVAKGETPRDFTEKEEPLIITAFDNIGTVKFSHKFNLYGTVVEFAKIFEGYLLSCNFTSLNTGVSSLSSKAGNTLSRSNIFLLKISMSGQISKYETIVSEDPVYTVGTIRLPNNRILIAGFEREMPSNWYIQRYNGLDKRVEHVINSSLQILE